ncbi:hypothetical protein Plhal304r1_c018g0065801 [Plasmopara halstedii]
MGLINYIKSLGTGDYAKIAITKLLIKLNKKGGASLVDDVVAAAPSLGSADLCDYFYHAALVITKREAKDVLKKLVSETEGDDINILGHQHFDLLVKYATFSEFPKLMVDHLRNVLIDKAILAYKKKSLYLDFVKDANSMMWFDLSNESWCHLKRRKSTKSVVPLLVTTGIMFVLRWPVRHGSVLDSTQYFSDLLQQ